MSVYVRVHQVFKTIFVPLVEIHRDRFDGRELSFLGNLLFKGFIYVFIEIKEKNIGYLVINWMAWIDLDLQISCLYIKFVLCLFCIEENLRSQECELEMTLPQIAEIIFWNFELYIQVSS